MMIPTSQNCPEKIMDYIKYLAWCLNFSNYSRSVAIVSIIASHYESELEYLLFYPRTSCQFLAEVIVMT
jgi:hypothetical protein